MIYIIGFLPDILNRTPMSYFQPLVLPFTEFVKRHGGDCERFPLEELVADFSEAARRNPSRFMPILAMLYQAIREWLYYLSCQNAKEFDAFVSHLRPGDIIVTFNWECA
jgi:hypothetical protein